MKKVTVRVPATTANLGPGFDAFGCALSLYTDVTFEETDSGIHRLLRGAGVFERGAAGRKDSY